jgi:hypothetical protein
MAHKRHSHLYRRRHNQSCIALRRDHRHWHPARVRPISQALQRVRQSAEAIIACQEAAVSYRDTGDRHGEGTALGNLELARAAQEHKT